MYAVPSCWVVMTRQAVSNKIVFVNSYFIVYIVTLYVILEVSYFS